MDDSVEVAVVVLVEADCVVVVVEVRESVDVAVVVLVEAD